MRYRLVERNDGKFIYQYLVEMMPDRQEWIDVNYLIFHTEEAARRSFIEIASFLKAHEIKRVLDEIEI